MTTEEPFIIGQDDTSRALRAIAKDSNNAVIAITGATIVFNSWPVGSKVNKITNGTVTINDGPTGDMEYPWQTGDTDTPGEYFYRFKVTYADGSILTVPNGKAPGKYIVTKTEP